MMAEVKGVVEKRNIVEAIKKNLFWPHRRVTIVNPTKEFSKWVSSQEYGRF
jgi:hypothetical protein